MDASFEIWFIFLLSFLLSGATVVSDQSLAFTKGTKPALVVLDPYVSALDKDNRFRCNVTDLYPLISKVATKFQRIYVPISPFDLKTGLTTSAALLPLAVAKYNELSSTTQKLEVWLGYSSTVPDYLYRDKFEYHMQPKRLIDRLLDISNEANKIHNSTVSAILLPYELVLRHLDEFKNDTGFPEGQRWGVMLITDNYFLDINFKTNILNLQPDIIVMVYRLFNSESQLIPQFNYSLKELQKYFGALEDWMTLGFLITIADTDEHGKLNITNLVTAWNTVIKWSENNGTTIILSKAFDTPYGESIERKTCGWWRLVENPFYKSSKDYIFEEKALLAIHNNLDEAEPDWKELQKRTHFYREYTEIVFSLYDITRAKSLKRWPDKEMTLLVNKVAQKFRKVVLLFHDDSEKGLRGFLYELLCIAELKDKVEITIIVMPYIQPLQLFKGNSFSADGPQYDIFREVLKSVKTYVIGYADDGSTNVAKDQNQLIMSGLRITSYNIGYAFNISVCGSYDIMTENETRKLNEILNSKDSHALVFHFTESEETVTLGAKRMFQQRKVVMEQCRKFISARNLTTVKLSFLMLHYAEFPNFYRNKWAIGNFVEYWQKLSKWASDTKTSIILSNAVDMHRYFKHTDKILPELGWWRYQYPNNVEGGLPDEYIWIDKLEDAIQRFIPDSKTGLKTYELILAVTIPIIVLLIVAISVVYFIRRNFREIYLTKLEIDEFFNGREASKSGEGTAKVPEKMAYEKSRYEIDTGAFTIGEELGSGEFGRVCIGKVYNGGGVTNVAIKMVNPQNIHKTAISGLLSEIKVLSYVGKHENITELVGANTRDIKMGKVHIFLELCELGSLHSYLHKMRPAVTDYVNIQAENQSTPIYSNVNSGMVRYQNIIANKKILLEPTFHQDLYRWSHEICTGMAYLASKHVVHADLATRNVLLNADKVAKICDFGLARKMYNYTNYVKQQQEPLPWRWMSPESLRMLQFNEKSDVWAYGVTLWEIYTLGDAPYPGLSWDLQFADMLEGGLRLGEPKYNNNNMYWIMKQCWQANADNRPSFKDLLAYFECL